MRILLDGRYIHDDFPGIGRYTFNLARALGALGEGDEILLLHDAALANSRYDLALLARSPDVRLVPCAVPRFVPAEQWQLPFVAKRLRPDIWHAPFYLKPWVLPCPSVVTIFDTIPMEGRGARARVHRGAARFSVRTSRRVLTPTRASRAALMSRLGVPAPLIGVTPLAADPLFGPVSPEGIEEVRGRLGLGHYVLHVSSGLGHKNMGHLLDAWRLVLGRLDAGRRLELAIVGHDAAPGLDRVRSLGRVSDGDLRALYSGAALVLVPSAEEGFALPLLEAMACGAPVGCSDIPSLAEVSGGAAGRFPPHDAPAMADVIVRLLRSAEERADLASRGLARSRHFAWSTTAAATRAVYREALA